METTSKLSRSEDVRPGKRLVVACDGKNDSPFQIYFSLFNRNNNSSGTWMVRPQLPIGLFGSTLAGEDH